MKKQPKFLLLLALFIYHIHPTEALAITAATSTSSALSVSTSSHAAITTAPSTLSKTSTSTTKSKTTQTELYLPISTGGLDPLGLAQVSGFYGPGAWAAWFLTIVASWIRLLREAKGKIDANMWFYLLGMNWAAKDLIQHIAKARWHGGKETVEGMMEMAQVGAAFSVVWWGLATAIAQVGVVFSLHEIHSTAPMSARGRQLFTTLLVGLFAPGISLTVAMFNVSSWPIPAIYYPGILEGNQQQTLIYISGTGIPCLLLSAGSGILVAFQYMPKLTQTRTTKILEFFLNRVLDNHATAYMITSFVITYIVGFSWFFINPLYLTWLIIPFIPAYMVASFIFPVMAYVMAGILAIAYIFSAYVPWGKTKISQSCYFMPCSASSIRDSDQAFALLAGLVTLIGVEIAPGLWREAKKRREALRTRAALQEADERIEIELARRTNSGVTRTPNSGLQSDPAQ